MLLILDLDGTLLNGKNEISAVDNESLINYSPYFDLVLASGRHFSEIEPLLPQIWIKPKYIICCDGVRTYDKKGFELNFINEINFLQANDVNKLFDIVKRGEAYLITNKKTLVYRESFFKRIRRFISGSSICRFSPTCHADIEKIRLMKRDVSEEEYRRLAEQFTIHIFFNRFIDVKKKGVSKYFAIHNLCKLEQITEDDVLYFGDDMNDIECFNGLKHCVAMGNACEYIKGKAEFITKTNNDGGVAWGLEHFFRSGVWNE